MSYTVDDYVKDYTKAHLHYLAPEEVLPRFSLDQRLQGLSPDQRLQGLSPDQRLQGLSPDEIEAYLSKLKSQRSH